MEGVSSAAVCLYRLREVRVCVRVCVRIAGFEGGGRELLFLFSINLLFISMGCSLYSLC